MGIKVLGLPPLKQWRNQPKDTTLHVNGEGRYSCFKIHKGLLAQVSPMFARWFSHEHPRTSLDVYGVKPFTFGTILDGLYSTWLNVNRHNVQEVFAVADFFLMEPIVNACVSFMHRTLSLRNCLSMWKLAGRFSHCLVELQRRAVRMMCQNLSFFYRSPKLYMRTLEFIQELLEESIGVPEIHRYRLATNWICQRLENSKPLDPGAAATLFDCINLDRISPVDLEREIGQKANLHFLLQHRSIRARYQQSMAFQSRGNLYRQPFMKRQGTHDVVDGRLVFREFRVPFRGGFEYCLTPRVQCCGSFVFLCQAEKNQLTLTRFDTVGQYPLPQVQLKPCPSGPIIGSSFVLQYAERFLCVIGGARLTPNILAYYPDSLSIIEPSNRMYFYHIETNTWDSSVSELSVGVAFAGTAVHPNGVIYIAGGLERRPESGFTHQRNSAYRLRVLSSHVHMEPISSMRIGRFSCALQQLRGALYAVGGCCMSNLLGPVGNVKEHFPVHQVEYYTIATNQWTLVQTVAIQVAAPVTYVRDNNRIVVFGGRSGGWMRENARPSRDYYVLEYHAGVVRSSGQMMCNRPDHLMAACALVSVPRQTSLGFRFKFHRGVIITSCP